MDYKITLEHHGILGQKWGVRRFQNKDGSLTSAGKGRYQSDKQYERAKSKALAKRDKFQAKARKEQVKQQKKDAKLRDLEKSYIDMGYTKNQARAAAKYHETVSKQLKIVGGVAIASTALTYRREKGAAAVLGLNSDGALGYSIGRTLRKAAIGGTILTVAGRQTSGWKEYKKAMSSNK